ncbi:acyl-CoA thioesterase [Nocardioides caeni]|uniref:acyl-CoA thioesterase n=1 Tax=Nocardioides caeni TaxID=574700 RepID=UPI0013050C86|nr:acyl-CoA thioesterase domain-containing protein [Nocardioides caeni]
MNDVTDPWTTPLPELVDLLQLTTLDEDHFEGGQSRASVVSNHVFGGLVAAQAVVAATRTVPDARAIHSLHTYFVRPGDPHEPITFVAERVRDGRSVSHRRVSARQHGRAIMEMSCSFTDPRPGVEHQVSMPAAPPPESVRPDTDVIREIGEVTSPYGSSPDAFDLRTVGLGPGWFRTQAPVDQPTLQWVRAAGPVPDDPALHAALFTFASDMRILHPAVRPHARALYDDDVIPATIDHAVWFHRPPRVDEWMLWVYDSPWAGSSRALCRASVHTPDGVMIASAAQEGLLRIG